MSPADWVNVALAVAMGAATYFGYELARINRQREREIDALNKRIDTLEARIWDVAGER